MTNKKKDLIEILHKCKNFVVDFEVEEAIEQAIKCVELMPELVDALSDADETLKLVHEDYKYGHYLKTDIDEMINKAKELIE